jgi:hypothetical protein
VPKSTGQGPAPAVEVTTPPVTMTLERHDPRIDFNPRVSRRVHCDLIPVCELGREMAPHRLPAVDTADAQNAAAAGLRELTARGPFSRCLRLSSSPEARARS